MRKGVFEILAGATAIALAILIVCLLPHMKLYRFLVMCNVGIGTLAVGYGLYVRLTEKR